MKYLFTKTDCEKCQWIKGHFDLSNIVVHNLDQNAEALGMLAYYECVVLAEKHLPILVVCDDGLGIERISDFEEIVAKIAVDSFVLPTKKCVGDSCRL